MVDHLSIMFGGQQGEGVEKTERIFCTALNRLGYFQYSYRHVSSRIKGGRAYQHENTDQQGVHEGDFRSNRYSCRL
jgi:Pyruvate/2-oxoacid:ferredoxin oxidoreductase gamma subunit